MSPKDPKEVEEFKEGLFEAREDKFKFLHKCRVCSLVESQENFKHSSKEVSPCSLHFFSANFYLKFI